MWRAGQVSPCWCPRAESWTRHFQFICLSHNDSRWQNKQWKYLSKTSQWQATAGQVRCHHVYCTNRRVLHWMACSSPFETHNGEINLCLLCCHSRLTRYRFYKLTSLILTKLNKRSEMVVNINNYDKQTSGTHSKRKSHQGDVEQANSHPEGMKL